MDMVATVSGLSVSYGRRPAVRSLSFDLKKGGSLGLLGANGAGKTSTLRALLGMVSPNEGSVHLLGSPPGVGVYGKIGFAPEEATPPEFLTGLEYLRILGGLKGAATEEAAALMDWFELEPHRKIGDYSKGMRRRIVLGQAFLGEPALLILDEPLNGLDPLMIKRLRERLEGYLKAGGSLLFSSHILAEVEKICSDVVILSRGELKASSPVAPLVEKHGSVEEAFSHLVGGSQ